MVRALFVCCLIRTDMVSNEIDISGRSDMVSLSMTFINSCASRQRMEYRLVLSVLLVVNSVGIIIHCLVSVL